MIDLDYDFVYFGVYVDADTISAPNEIVFSYSMDGGDNYVDLEDIGGLASFSRYRRLLLLSVASGCSYRYYYFKN